MARIVSTKKQNKMLKEIAICQRLCFDKIDDLELLDEITSHLACIARDIDSKNSANMVIDYCVIGYLAEEHKKKEK